MSRLQRIVFRLNDGRHKYATHNGEILLWDKEDIESLHRNIELYGMPAFTADFAKYATSYRELRTRYPKAKIVRVAAVENEDSSLPLDPDIIF